MNAREARRMTDENMPRFDGVYSLIKAAAKNADSFVRYDPKGNEKKHVDKLILELKSKGYDVKREKGYDQRDQEEWDYLIINW